MEVGYADEQEQLRASVRGVIERHAPLTAVRARIESHAGRWDTGLWDRLDELGVREVAAEAMVVDAGVALEELGRGLAAVPYGSLLTAGTLRAVLGCPPPTGVETVVLDGDVVVGSGPTLAGTARWVPDAIAADTLLVVADDTVHVVAAGDAVIEPQESVDPTRPFATVVLDGTPAELLADRSTGRPSLDAAVAGTRDLAALVPVLDSLGAAGRALELAVAYAKDRHQFGAPIGSFQAVQHLAADMLRDLELLRAAAHHALWAVDEWRHGRDVGGRGRHHAVTVAKAWAGDAGYRIGASAIQIFGGVGFTWEHDIHLFYKRLLTAQHERGGSGAHLDELASLLLDG